MFKKRGMGFEFLFKKLLLFDILDNVLPIGGWCDWFDTLIS